MSQHQTRQPAASEEPLLQTFADQHGERGMQAEEAARLMSFLVQTESARKNCVLLPPRAPDADDAAA